MVNPEWGQQCIFDVFLTKLVGINGNLGNGEGLRERQGGGGFKGLNPQTPTNRALFKLFEVLKKSEGT